MAMVVLASIFTRDEDCGENVGGDCAAAAGWRRGREGLSARGDHEGLRKGRTKTGVRRRAAVVMERHGGPADYKRWTVEFPS